MHICIKRPRSNAEKTGEEAGAPKPLAETSDAERGGYGRRLATILCRKS